MSEGGSYGNLRGAGTFLSTLNPTPIPMFSSSNSKAAFSIPSLIAIAAAIGSFSTGAFWGLVLAIVAIVAGLLGIILSLSPKIRGGVFSTFGVVAGIIGIVAAICKLVF